MTDILLPYDYCGSVCEIKTMENEVISTGSISNISDDCIKIENKNDTLKLIDYGKLIKINIFNSECGFRVVVGNVYTSTINELSVINLLSLIDHERRNFFRVDMDMATKAVYQYGPEDSSLREIDIVVKDMSLCGLRFKSDSTFELGTDLTVTLNLPKEKSTYLHCKIVRIINDTTDNSVQYGCEFVTGNNKDSNWICSFLFRMQRQVMKNTRDLPANE